MHNDIVYFLISAILSIASWSTPQPKLSTGLLVVYGNQRLVEANADWHGYNLSLIPDRCGFSAISPAHLGQLAYFSVDGEHWIGPCQDDDAVSRGDAYDSIYGRHEIAEIRRSDALKLGFEYGHQGYIYFSPCPPRSIVLARPYAPPLSFDYPPYDYTPSFYPYPEQQKVVRCNFSLRKEQ